MIDVNEHGQVFSNFILITLLNLKLNLKAGVSVLLVTLFSDNSIILAFQFALYILISFLFH